MKLVSMLLMNLCRKHLPGEDNHGPAAPYLDRKIGHLMNHCPQGCGIMTWCGNARLSVTSGGQFQEVSTVWTVPPITA